jgi:peptide/nickel transport system substrate-binding protein
VKFQDGTPFDAQAVVDNFTYIMKPSTHSQSAAAALGPYLSSKALSKYVVQVNFKIPYPPLLNRASQPELGMQSPKGIAAYAKNASAMPVGTGPFQIMSYTPNSQVVLQANSHYNWAPPALGVNGPPKISKIVYHIVSTDQNRVNELQTGQAQFGDQMPGLYFKEFKDNPSYKSVIVNVGGMPNAGIFNVQKFPTNDVKVRQAIMYAVNRKQIIQFADQGQIPAATGPIEQGTFGFDKTLTNDYPYNPGKAAALLKSDGWKKVNGIWTKNGKQLSLLLVAITNFDFPTEAQAFQRFLQKAGMVAKLELLPGTAWQNAVVAGKENVSVSWFYADVDADVLRLVFTKGEFFNFSKYYDPTVNKLLIDASTSTSKARRLKDYSQAQRIIMQQAAFIPIHNNVDLVVISSKLQHLTPWPGGYTSLYTASLGS